MECIKIPFRSKTDTGSSFKAVGYIYINNGFIVKQEVKLSEAFVATRILTSEKKETVAYISNVKKTNIRNILLGEFEYKRPSETKEVMRVKLNNEQLNEINSVVSEGSTGTILSTLLGVLCYTAATGGNKNIKASPIVIDGGIFDSYRFYNLFTNEFNKSSQIQLIRNEVEYLTIEEWVGKTKVNRLMFGLYNYDKDSEYLLSNDINPENFAFKTYEEVLKGVAIKTNKRNAGDIIDLYRREFKKKVMREAKYKLDFVFNDTKKENTEAAHIYEVHTIKKVESLEEWNLISDVDNCLLLTPSVHKAWDREQIDITPSGNIINTGMEERRFQRLFSPANFIVNFNLSDRQKMYLRKRRSIK